MLAVLIAALAGSIILNVYLERQVIIRDLEIARRDAAEIIRLRNETIEEIIEKKIEQMRKNTG